MQAIPSGYACFFIKGSINLLQNNLMCDIIDFAKQIHNNSKMKHNNLGKNVLSIPLTGFSAVSEALF